MLDYQLIIASFAFFVSIFSVAISVKALRTQKQHFKKSVKPILKFGLKDYSNFMCVRMKNVGFGPLLIKTFKATNLTNGDTAKSIYQLMPDCPSGISWNDYWDFNTPEPTTLAANEEIPLIELVITPENISEKDFQMKVRKVLKNVEVEVSFTDLYDQLSRKSRIFDFFGRPESDLQAIKKN